jgi:hypothetical protein
VIVLLGPGLDPSEYREWAGTCPVAPTIVAEVGGDLSYDNLTLEELQRRLLQVKWTPSVGPAPCVR